MPDRIVTMGAGALSLGFFGPELRDQYALTFLDVRFKADLVQAINTGRSYAANLAGDTLRPIEVQDVDAFLIDDPAQEAAVREHIAQASIFFTAVGMRNFDSAIGYLAERLKDRTDDVYVLCSENGEDITQAWREKTPPNIHLLDTVMGRMCRIEEQAGGDDAPVAPGLGWAVVAEEFYGMPLSDRFANPDVFHSPAFEFVSDAEFQARDRVKLFAHNGLHCYLAVQGRLRGVERFSDMAGDAEVEGAARALLDEEIAAALWKECGPHLDEGYLRDYFERLPGRLLSTTLRDHVARGIRGLADKFAPNERIVGGLGLLLRNGIEPKRYLAFIADALRVARMDEGEEGYQKALNCIPQEEIREEVARRAGE